MIWDIGHPSRITFLTSAPTAEARASVRSSNRTPGYGGCVLQHPMSRNIASGRSFKSLRTRWYAGILLAILSVANLNPRMQGYGKI